MGGGLALAWASRGGAWVCVATPWRGGVACPGGSQASLPTDKALVDAYKHGLCRAQVLAFKRDPPMFLVYCDFEMAQK
jgi:hypothetical protein